MLPIEKKGDDEAVWMMAKVEEINMRHLHSDYNGVMLLIDEALTRTTVAIELSAYQRMLCMLLTECLTHLGRRKKDPAAASAKA